MIIHIFQGCRWQERDSLRAARTSKQSDLYQLLASPQNADVERRGWQLDTVEYGGREGRGTL